MGEERERKRIKRERERKRIKRERKREREEEEKKRERETRPEISRNNKTQLTCVNAERNP